MSDSDEDKKQPGAPSWQAGREADDTSNAEDTTKDTPPSDTLKDGESITEPLTRQTIIDQARKFLEEDEVRNATTDKKIAFLELKGLRSDEIQTLLGITRNEEATSTTLDTSSPKDSPNPPPSTSPPVQQYTHTTTTSKSTLPSSSSAPPIITYPEFLTTPTSPTPLITTTRLLTTLYLFSGLSALLYGTSTYLVTPMIASLTESRLSLAATSKENLQKLIERLEGVVSEIPSSQKLVGGGAGEVDGESEEDEDPTELFHRDIGVQTSPPSSGTSTPSLSVPTTALSSQTSRLSSLKNSLQGLLEESSSEGHQSSELEGTIGILREYLDSMAYIAPTYGYGGGGYSGGGSGGKDADDEISKVKASIRGVKGVLLSARSFPAGVRAGGR